MVITREKLGIFIVCHDQKLILDFHNSMNKLFIDDLPYFYILVGQSPKYNLLQQNQEIFSRLHIPIEHGLFNMENYPGLLTFTAWYYISRMYDIDLKYENIAIFEYDVDFKEKISKLTHNLNGNNTISFITERMDNNSFLKPVPGLVSELDLKYKGSIKAIQTYYQEHEDYFWGATTNQIVSIKFLIDFVNWYMRLIPDIFVYKNYPHFHERAIKIFSILNNYNTLYFPSYLTHRQNNSHGIGLL